MPWPGCWPTRATAPMWSACPGAATRIWSRHSRSWAPTASSDRNREHRRGVRPSPVPGGGAGGFGAGRGGGWIGGVLGPARPLEEAAGRRAVCDERGIALVPLAAPTTPEARLAEIGATARGFLYMVSLTGTTGERSSLPDQLGEMLARAAAHTEVPVALGFGIGPPEQVAAAAAAGAAGVIIGTRLVRAAGGETAPARP